jgi:hypothetical protein
MEKEQDILVYVDGKGTSAKYADGRAYPVCDKACRPMG